MPKYIYYQKQGQEEWREIKGDFTYYHPELDDTILVPFENLEIWDQDDHFEAVGITRLTPPPVPEGYYVASTNIDFESGKPVIRNELIEIPQSIISKQQFLTGLVHIGILNMDALVEAGAKNDLVTLVMSNIKKSLTVAETIAIITKWNSPETNILIGDEVVKAILDDYSQEDIQKFFNQWHKL